MDNHSSAEALQSSPVFRLPVELLARIFEIGTFDSGDSDDATNFPTLVSSVSRHFRSVALQTSNLWTTLRFYSKRPSWHFSNSDEEYDYTYPRDLLWISRSKTCPLNLILSFRDGTWNFNENKHYFHREHMETILAFLSPHASRIKRFTLLCDTFAPLYAALRFLTKHGSAMENIQMLELYRCNEFPAEHPVFYPEELAKPIPLFAGCCASRLTHVVLSGVHVDWYRSQAPLSDLRTLELAFHCRDVRPSVSEFTQLLEASPLLVSLAVVASGPCTTPLATGQNSGCAPSPCGDAPRICLPLLRSLHIGYQCLMDGLALLHLIDAPSVLDLIVADTSRPSETDTESGSCVLETLALESAKTTSRLETLCLRGVKATAQAFASLLDAHSRLRTLNLVNASKHALSVLASPSLSSPDVLICPALKRLSVQFMPCTDMGSVAKARAEAGMPLEELSLHVWDKINDEDLALSKKYSKLVTFFGHQDLDDEEETDWGENSDPYAPGGAFNDPEFDSMFT